MGFSITLCLPHSVMHPKRSTYAECSDSILRQFYHKINSENIHPIRVYLVLYFLNIKIKMRSHHLLPIEEFEVNEEVRLESYSNVLFIFLLEIIFALKISVVHICMFPH